MLPEISALLEAMAGLLLPFQLPISFYVCGQCGFHDSFLLVAQRGLFTFLVLTLQFPHSPAPKYLLFLLIHMVMLGFYYLSTVLLHVQPHATPAKLRQNCDSKSSLYICYTDHLCWLVGINKTQPIVIGEEGISLGKCLHKIGIKISL